MDVENLPMFVYQLPPGTTDVLLTNRVIFTITHQEQSDEVNKFYIHLTDFGSFYLCLASLWNFFLRIGYL